MKILRWLLTSLLAVVLILSTPLSYAQAITTPETFQMPNSIQIAKRISRTKTVAIVYAVEQLIEAVDWVLDPENNQVRYKDLATAQGNIRIIGGPVIFCDLAQGKTLNNIGELMPLSTACWQRSKIGQGGTVLNYEIKKRNIYVNLRSQSGGKYHDIYEFSTITSSQEKSISLDAVAQQIIQNAKSGHVPSQQFVEAVADDIAKQNTSTQTNEQTDAKPTNPPKDEPDDKCKLYIDPINYQTGIVKHRYYDLLLDRHGLYPIYNTQKHPSGYGTYQGHIQRFKMEQNELNRLILLADMSNCTKYVSLDARHWAQKIAPIKPNKSEAHQNNFY